MKRFLAFLLVLTLVTAFAFSFSASAEESVLLDLLPKKDMNSDMLSCTGCALDYNFDGSVTVTMTATSATVVVTLVDGGTILMGEPLDLSKNAFVVADYGSADGVTLVIHANYTRKDKEAAGTVADLFLSSMESSEYAQYAKTKGSGYVIWDWGTYVSSAPAKIFDNKLHRFTRVEYTFTGAVGTKLTLYRFYVGSSETVDGIGTVRPEKTVIAVSSEAPEESSAVSEAVSEATSEAVSEVTSEAVSEATSEAVSEATSETASTAVSAASSSASSVSEEEDGFPTWAWIAIAAAVAVIAAAVILIVKKKK